ncbi:MAG TPA: hypothetical protein IAC20_05940 [Candidatus Faecisoma merdavium]|nr:hypothetical protein [Candidatus Faecisoma merdavium]
MERSSRVIAVVALCVAVVGLTLGFAAFSNTLTISSDANVTPDASTFNVDFSSSDSSLATDPIVPVKNPSSLVAGEGTINNTSNPTVSGLSATFKEPGQKVTYTFYARNVGEYVAYLNSINFNNVASGSTPKKCTAGDGSTDALVQAACDDITLSVKVGSESETTGSLSSISGHSLAKNASEEIIVEIEYNAGGDRADGDFTVEFGDITLVYSSVD